MPIDPSAIGATTEATPFEWTDRDTLLYALGVGCGAADLASTTANSPATPQQAVPTYAVIACPAWGAAAKVGSFNWAKLLHGSQQIRLHAPLPPAGRLDVSSQVVDIQDKGEGKNALGQVDIVAEYKGRKFHGMGLATDIIESSAQALVHVINSIWRADQVAEQMERNHTIKSETV